MPAATSRLEPVLRTREMNETHEEPMYSKQIPGTIPAEKPMLPTAKITETETNKKT